MAPEHKRLNRYKTLDLQAIKDIPVQVAAEETAHLLSMGSECTIARRFSGHGSLGL
jgi:hypothetical protein